MIWNRLKNFVLLLDNYPEFRIRFDKTQDDLSSGILLKSLLDGRPYIPFTKYSLSPYAIQLILNDILIHERKNIVEVGSGAFTYLLCRLIKSNNLNVEFYSIDSNLEWQKKIKNGLNQENLENRVKLIHAPINESNWHDTTILDDTFEKNSIDSLIVDGPQSVKGEERHAALPYFFDKMNKESFSIFLDDAHRKGEKRVIDNWAKEFPELPKFHMYGQRIAGSLKNSPFYISPAWHSYNSVIPIGS